MKKMDWSVCSTWTSSWFKDESKINYHHKTFFLPLWGETSRVLKRNDHRNWQFSVVCDNWSSYEHVLTTWWRTPPSFLSDHRSIKSSAPPAFVISPERLKDFFSYVPLTTGCVFWVLSQDRSWSCKCIVLARIPHSGATTRIRSFNARGNLWSCDLR